MLRIPVEDALKRAQQSLPENSEVIELSCLPDGQWLARYIVDSPARKNTPRVTYELLECPLFDYNEL